MVVSTLMPAFRPMLTPNPKEWPFCFPTVTEVSVELVEVELPTVSTAVAEVLCILDSVEPVTTEVPVVVVDEDVPRKK